MRKSPFPYFFMRSIFFLKVGESGKSTLLKQGYSQFMANVFLLVVVAAMLFVLIH